MKTLKLVAAIVLVCLAGAAQADVIPGNFLSNGDFDTDLTGWGANWNVVAWTADTPDGGGVALGTDVTVPVQGSQAAAVLTANALPGDYILRLDAYAPEATGLMVAQVWADSGTGWWSGGSLVYGVVPNAGLIAGWATYSFPFTIAPGIESQTLAVTIDSQFGTSTYYADNVSLTLTTIPEPSTLVLMALGVCGLLCYAWRKRK